MTGNYSNELGLRFKERYDELKWLYFEQYHNDKIGFDYLCKLIKDYYADRDEKLKALDRERSADPSWIRGSGVIGMMLYVDNFAGDLRGMSRKLDYFTEIGVNQIHMMPLLESPFENKSDRYAVSDFRRIQPELGTMDDLRRLTSLCHGRGISCCLNMALNHTSDEHEWAKAARAGDTEARSRYFIFDSWDVPNGYECTKAQALPKEAPGNFTQLDSGEIVMTTFYPNQWDLNYANPMVFNDMTENLLYLANAGIDVIRLDDVPFIRKELGTSCRDLPQAHNIVRMMKIVCEIVCPSVIILGDIAEEPPAAAAYFGVEDKPECDMLCDVTAMSGIWNSVATRDVRLIKRHISRLAELPRDYLFLNYIRCQKEIGWTLDYEWLRDRGMEEAPHKMFLNDYYIGKFGGSVSRGELYGDESDLLEARVCGTTASLCGIEAAEWDGDENAMTLAVDADIMLHALLLTQSGVPVIYSGDEVGQLNDYLYHADIRRKFDSRNLHRGKFDWLLAEKRYDPESYQSRIFTAVQKLCELRSSNEVFKADAEFYPLATGSPNVLGLYRAYGSHKLLALFNFCEEERTVSFEYKRAYTDLMTGAKHNKKYIDLKPYGFVWALLK